MKYQLALNNIIPMKMLKREHEPPARQNLRDFVTNYWS